MNRTIRQAHRWISLAFMLMVLANFAVMPLGNDTLGMAVGGLLMVTGIYLFVLPYVRPGRPSP